MKKIYLLILLVKCSVFLQAQSNKKAAELEALAEYAFEQLHYSLAFPHFYSLHEQFPNNLNYKLKLGVCYIHKSDEHEKALPLLLDVYREKPKTRDLNFLLGQARHKVKDFKKAEEYFRLYLNESGNKNKEITELNLAWVENAKKLTASSVDREIVNFGKRVNTRADEYVPVLSSDEKVLIFTYRGEKSTGGLQNLDLKEDPYGQYYEDIFISKKENGDWSIPEGIGNGINSRGHDAAIALSADGQKLFTYRDHISDGGDIYISYLEGENWTTPERLRGDVNTSSWEGSVSLSADEKTLYFSSERPGGFGGKDLYKASLMPGGDWGNVENLGDNFNTPFDEDAPYIHPDGTILHFSSNGPTSMGGFDIFSCKLVDGEWSKPENLGYPVNGVDDDIYYVLSADGEKGFYSSGKSGGSGGQDLYVVTPGFAGVKPVIIMVNGTVRVNEIPVGAAISVAYSSNGNEHGSFKANSSTGKYLFNLPSGTVYTVRYEVEGHEPETREIPAADLKTYTELTIDIDLYTPDYVKPEEKRDTTEVPAVEDFSLEGLQFKVQIAAYNLPQNYNYSPLSTLGQPEKIVLEDGITRFTLGNFATLREADEFKKRVIGLGQTDAFVTAVYQGKRVYIEELYKQILKTEIPERE